MPKRKKVTKVQVKNKNKQVVNVKVSVGVPKRGQGRRRAATRKSTNEAEPAAPVQNPFSQPLILPTIPSAPVQQSTGITAADILAIIQPLRDSIKNIQQTPNLSQGQMPPTTPIAAQSSAPSLPAPSLRLSSPIKSSPLKTPQKFNYIPTSLRAPKIEKDEEQEQEQNEKSLGPFAPPPFIPSGIANAPLSGHAATNSTSSFSSPSRHPMSNAFSSFGTTLPPLPLTPVPSRRPSLLDEDQEATEEETEEPTAPLRLSLSQPEKATDRPSAPQTNRQVDIVRLEVKKLSKQQFVDIMGRADAGGRFSKEKAEKYYDAIMTGKTDYSSTKSGGALVRISGEAGTVKRALEKAGIKFT